MANLFQGGPAVAIGKATLRGPADENLFESTFRDIPDNFPQTEGTMSLEGIAEKLYLIDFLSCKRNFGLEEPPLEQRRHFHFRFEIVGSFVHQALRFEKLLGHDRQFVCNTFPPPKDVLSFAEKLMVCQTEEQAASRIGLDREAAKGCLEIAKTGVSAYEKENGIILTASQMPFAALSTVVIWSCRKHIAKTGRDQWVRNSDSPKLKGKA
jgi:hypothetical protein